MMDDMFDLSGFYGVDEDSMLSEFDGGFEPQRRDRAHTWPSRPAVAQIVDEQSSAGSEASPGVVPPAGPRLLSTDDGDHGSHVELQLSPGGGVTTCRKASSRRNAWGNLSYADLITRAIDSSPEKRLTLSQIYAWMVSNVPFFSDKGDSNSSAGWKNSIRHNLSLHSRFIRVQNEGAGKSSWWMVNPEAVSKLPRKRAGTMDSTTCRRPTRPSKRLPSSLKHARSTELHGSANELFDPNAARGSPSIVGTEALPGFDSPRVRANSGNSSNSGCSPAALGTPLETDIKPCFTMPPSAWDALYPPKQETLSESLADILISDAAGGRSVGENLSPSFGGHQSLQHQQQQQQQQMMFMTNEAYAHGVPVHQPSPQLFVPQSVSPTGGCNVLGGSGGYSVAVTSPGGGYQMNGGQGFSCNGGTATERVPTLGELLQDQQGGSGYLLNTFLTSGGSVMSQPPGWAGGEVAGIPAAPQQPAAGASGTALRRPLHINQRLLMQLLATKPHLARRLQQLLEAKRRQLSAMQQSQSPLSPPAPAEPCPVPSASPASSCHVPDTPTLMLQQLLTGGSPKPQPISVDTLPPLVTTGDEAFPQDLDLSLLDLESTSEINCDIEQVIHHELSFGDKLDFSFDQLHLDEFDVDFAS